MYELHIFLHVESYNIPTVFGGHTRNNKFLDFSGGRIFIGLSATCWFLWNMTILLLPNNKKGIEGFDKLQYFNSNFKRTIPWIAGGVILADFGGIIFGTW